jgi:putative endonuclease
MIRQPCIYILTSGPRGTLYIGVTADLPTRLHQHRTGCVPGFTHHYGVTKLVHYEIADTMDSAIAREKQLKRWHRAWKINLIESQNPYWTDLAIELGLADVGLHSAKPDGP